MSREKNKDKDMELLKSTEDYSSLAEGSKTSDEAVLLEMINNTMQNGII